MYKELIKQISNLTIEYIDQITADGRVNFAAIRFEEREIDGKKVIAMDIYVFQTNFIRHFNTKVPASNSVSFSRNLLTELIKEYQKNKDFKLSPFKKSAISVTRNRPDSYVPVSIQFKLKVSASAVKTYNEKISK